MKIKNKDRLTALDIFIRPENVSLITKEEIIAGIRTILSKKILTPEAEYLLKQTTDQTNKNRKVSNVN